MAGTIRESADQILVALSSEPTDGLGEARVRGGRLVELTGLDPQQVNYAVRALRDHGYVDRSSGIGTTPFEFREVWVTVSGRMAIEDADVTDDPSTELEEALPRIADHSSVFVVHGRNLLARTAMFRFLRALSLTPIEWAKAISMTGEASPFIGQVLDAAFARAQAVVVLLTGDDVVQLREVFLKEDDPDYEGRLTPQARPNVLFEAGMAFGTHPTRTLLVVLGDIKPFSDIAGRHVVKIDDSLESRSAIAERLRAAGCHVDTGGTDWKAEGAFDDAIANVGLPAAVQADDDARPEIEEKILKLMWDGDGKSSVHEITRSLGIDQQKARYHLGELENNGMAGSLWTISETGDEYELTHWGRDYLVRRGLV